MSPSLAGTNQAWGSAESFDQRTEPWQVLARREQKLPQAEGGALRPNRKDLLEFGVTTTILILWRLKT